MNLEYKPFSIYQNGDDIKDILQLNTEEISEINSVCRKYPMQINDYYISLIDGNNPNDPIRKMSIPSKWELKSNGTIDTSGEIDNTIFPGVQHKYKQTLLILSTNECYMYCRHCFRKRLVGISNAEIILQLNNVTDYLDKHPSINNILITGGDAFHNSNDIIKQYLELFTKFKQIDFIRFGTRTPVVFPNRIIKDENLLNILTKYNKKKQMSLFLNELFSHDKPNLG